METISKFNIYALSDEMQAVSTEANAFASEESSTEIQPEHILKSLIASDSSIILKAYGKLNENIRPLINADQLMDRLSGFSNPTNLKGFEAQQNTNLSDTSEKLLHDAEMIAILRERPVSREDLFEAIVLETFLSPENRNLDIVGYALGMRPAPAGTVSRLYSCGDEDESKTAPDPDCKGCIGYNAQPGKRIQELKTMSFVKTQMKAIADKAPTWKNDLNALNCKYAKPIRDYVKVKVYLSMMANNLDDCAQSGQDAASDFFLTKLSDGELYRKYMTFSKSKPDAHFRAYIIESANNFVIDFVKGKGKEKRIFLPIESQKDSGNEFTSSQPSPATWMRKSEKKKIVTNSLQEFISELLCSSSQRSSESNKHYFYIIYERLISPILYGNEEPSLRKMAEKLALLTGQAWTVNKISAREITVMSKLKIKMSQALDN